MQAPDMSYSLSHDMLMRGIKMIDLGFIASIYFCMAFAVALSMDKVLGMYDQDRASRKSTPRLVAEALVHIWVVGIIVYVARNLAELVPFPLDGFHGFQHMRVKELSSASFFTFVLLLYSFNLKDRLFYLYQRLSGQKQKRQ